MAKKKSTRKPQAKVRLTLEKHFTCLFCNHEKSVECKINREHRVGTLSCRICAVRWQTHINSLSEPIDVYSEWIDACEAAASQQQQQRRLAGAEAADGEPEPEVWDEDQLGRGDYRPRAAPPKQKARGKPESEVDSEEDRTDGDADSEDNDFIVKDDVIEREDDGVEDEEEAEASETSSDDDELPAVPSKTKSLKKRPKSQEESKPAAAAPSKSDVKGKKSALSAELIEDSDSDESDDEDVTVVKRRRLTQLDDF